MLRSLYNIHRGQTLAIVGSGPSANLFSSNHPVSIGVNGASLLGARFDYYLCGDHGSAGYDWFFVNCSRIRVIAKIIASMDYQLYPDHLYQDIKREAVRAQQQHKINIPEPVYPHRTFRYERYKRNKLAKNQNALLYGGTISCCALQLAWLMGAESVVLYGCEFSHKTGHYFYDTDKPGKIVNSQRTVMQDAIDCLRGSGLHISIIGDSTLQ